MKTFLALLHSTYIFGCLINSFFFFFVIKKLYSVILYLHCPLYLLKKHKIEIMREITKKKFNKTCTLQNEIHN